MTELQAALLLAQLTRLEEQMLLREKNAALLDQMLSEVKGIQLIKRSPSITRHAHHLYMFKLAPGAAGTMGKEDFIRKVEAEGIPVSAGYSSLNRNEAILAETRERAGEDRTYACPVSERLCEQEVVWLPHTVLLSDEEAIQDISRGIEKVLQSYQ
ncbi:DegT/DnrJ/EryC1/StrS family aminotransferase [Paenibacillus sp. CC-CFT747]|nr:DegT/DnrJ/EryC1/StrS family aminotransferase [Paenibacillus sp. CC-CFT747]